MTNKVILSGSLVNDPIYRITKHNNGFALFVLKVARDDSPYHDYINCVCWDEQLAQAIATKAHKGDILNVIGKMQNNNYNCKNGKVYSYQVTVLECRKFVPRFNTKSQTKTSKPQLSTEKVVQHVLTLVK